MARIVKEVEYAQRRSEILTAAQQLFFTKGYEQTSIADLLAALNISKGAFYHYYESKQDLLEALIDRIYKDGEQVVLPIVADPALPMLQKLERFFSASAQFKTEHKEYLIAMTRIWYADENTLLRYKVEQRLLRAMAPMLTAIIRQGVQEGVLTTRFPEQAAQISLSLLMSLSNSAADWVLAQVIPERAAAWQGDFTDIEQAVAAHTDALERTLGAPPGSLKVIDLDLLRDWFVRPPVAADTVLQTL